MGCSRTAERATRPAPWSHQRLGEESRLTSQPWTGDPIGVSGEGGRRKRGDSLLRKVQYSHPFFKTCSAGQPPPLLICSCHITPLDHIITSQQWKVQCKELRRRSHLQRTITLLNLQIINNTIYLVFTCQWMALFIFNSCLHVFRCCFCYTACSSQHLGKGWTKNPGSECPKLDVNPNPMV